jgi:hypothetical protein
MATTTSKATKTKLSPAQYAARLANAQRATGPRSDHGKARAAKNALLHGLCSLAPVLPGEDPAEFEAMLAQYLKEMEPGNADERRMVYDMCCAARAVDRVRKADAAAATVRMQQAGEAFDAARRQSLAQLTCKVGPRELALLLPRADGVRWLIGRWEELAARLEHSGHLCPHHRAALLPLLGCDPNDFAEECVREVHGLGLALEVALEDHTDTHAGFLAKGIVVDDDRPLERLRGIIAAEREALETLLPELEAEEAEQRQQAIDAVLIDTSADGARRHRYLMDHQRTLRQLSAALIASKTARLKLYGRILSSSSLRGEPDWTPPAPAAPAQETQPRNEPKDDATYDYVLALDETPAPSIARPASQVVVGVAPAPMPAPPRRA